jgi:16S rRNA (uracil1498-N3)-methyltransferase
VSRPHVFVADLDTPELDPGDRHHLERVLRIGAGEELTVSDGNGSWRTCRFGDVLEPLDEIRTEPQPAPPVAVAFAPVKGDRPEWAVQKLTELGVDAIVLLTAERSVVRWDGDRAGRHLDRLRKVAREAAMQSRRVRLPVIEGPLPFATVAGRPGACLAAPGGGPITTRTPLVLVGPEGGWSPAELDADLPRVELGPNVLRTETAAVAAGALFVAIRAGLVRTAAP